MIIPQDIIRKKRNNLKLTNEEITDFVNGITNDQITDAQISALAMTIYFNGLSKEETISLTLAMRNSGEVIKWPNLNGPLVDKHSTGGVGDLVSLALGPMVASLGAYIPMIAGRGLGHTGGTVDKLESIPGYNTMPDLQTFQKCVKTIGVAIVGQSAKLAPADKRIYAVRDTTATTEQISLITSSILSKKLASGIDALVMDVKTGSGAFLEDLNKSQELANNIVEIGNGAHCKTSALITDMNQPLSHTIGNSLEIIETIKYLKGECDNIRLHSIIMALGVEMLISSSLCNTKQEAEKKLLQSLNKGYALEYFNKMISFLGAPNDFSQNYHKYLSKANYVKSISSDQEGVITKVDTKKIGMAIVALGGGRLNPLDSITHSNGIEALITLGTKVKSGQQIATLHASNEDQFNFVQQKVKEAITVDHTMSVDNYNQPKLVY